MIVLSLISTAGYGEEDKQAAGSRYFCESFYGHPCPTSGKNYATANAFGGPSRPASLVAYPTRGMQHRYRNDSTRCRKACIFTTQKTLRENTCPIASGDYSTPVSQRMCFKLLTCSECYNSPGCNRDFFACF